MNFYKLHKRICGDLPYGYNHKRLYLVIPACGYNREIKQLTEHGIPFDDPRVIRALERFRRADLEWKQLEAEHLQLRTKLGIVT